MKRVDNDKAEASFQHSLETAEWLRAIGYHAEGDKLERQARALNDREDK